MEELITHNEEGFIVPTRDPEAIANQIIELNEVELNPIKLASRKKVEKQHSELKMIEGMIKLYNDV
jgi:colanic acid/amylovoran biosynthesis glycosyltransferase